MAEQANSDETLRESAGKILCLPGAQLTPEVLLAQLHERLGRIAGLVVVIQWDDESMDTEYSSMKASHVCMAAKVLDMTAQDILNGD